MRVFLIVFHVLFCTSSLAQIAKLPTQWTKAAMAAAVPFPEYPRPQLERREWMCLNGKWDYMGGKQVASALNPVKPVHFNDKPAQILVPYCPESVLSGIERKQEVNMWYRRTFEIPVAWKGKQVIVNFEAVDHDATVFVNGEKAGTHAGGYSSFHINITKFLKAGVNTMVVAAHDLNDGRTPAGKNGPRGDYTFTSGIWQSVWLEPVSERYVQGVRLLPDVGNGRLEVVVDAGRGDDGMAASVGDGAGAGSAGKAGAGRVDGDVKVTVLDGGKEVVSMMGHTGMKLYVPVKDAKLWTPDDPFLYDLKITLHDNKGKIVDEVRSYFGMRDIKLGKVNGVIRPLLNNEFVMQLGLLDQGYWPDGVLTAPTEEALKYDIAFTKKAGFNLIRKHMKTEPKRFYYWADKMGLLVWQDMPAIWYPDEDTARTRSNFRRELAEMISDLYNAPSIITWVPFNENWGAFDVKEMTAWVKVLDPSRLVNGNSGFNNNPDYQKAAGDPGNGDFVDTHIYVGPYGASVPDSKRAASLGEFGGVGLFVRGHMWPVENNAYDYEATRERLTDRYVLLMDEVEQLMRYKGLSVAVYTQTTDVEHEVNGILTYDREVEKMDIKRVKEVNEAVIKAGCTLK